MAIKIRKGALIIMLLMMEFYKAFLAIEEKRQEFVERLHFVSETFNNQLPIFTDVNSDNTTWNEYN